MDYNDTAIATTTSSASVSVTATLRIQCAVRIWLAVKVYNVQCILCTIYQTQDLYNTKGTITGKKEEEEAAQFIYRVHPSLVSIVTALLVRFPLLLSFKFENGIFFNSF